VPTAKPVLHGRDHEPGGADPLTSFKAENVGDVLTAAADGLTEWAPAASGGEGVQFDTSPQPAEFLSWELTADFTSDTAGSQYFDADGGFQVQTGEDIGLLATTDMTLDAGTAMTLGAGGTIQIGTAVTDGVTIGPNLMVVSQSGEVVELSTSAGWTSGRVVVNISNGSGTKLQVIGNGGVPILEVRDDNTFHIKSGASWVSDL
jgi:hypothetical protein